MSPGCFLTTPSRYILNFAYGLWEIAGVGFEPTPLDHEPNVLPGYTIPRHRCHWHIRKVLVVTKSKYKPGNAGELKTYTPEVLARGCHNSVFLFRNGSVNSPSFAQHGAMTHINRAPGVYMYIMFVKRIMAVSNRETPAKGVTENGCSR